MAKRGQFNAQAFPFRQGRWEANGQLYERLGVRRWKGRLPSCGSFDKRHLSNAGYEYLSAFVTETCRAEAIHLSIILPAPLFFLFNPPIGGIIILLYLLLENLPCVIAQRYNRIRLLHLLSAVKQKKAGAIDISPLF
jgi:glycosyl-4,4'-diaponeurosporenoate acyltransferase